MPRRAAYRGARVDAGRQRPPEFVAVIVACSPKSVTTSEPKHQPAPKSARAPSRAVVHVACGGRGGAEKCAREAVQNVRGMVPNDVEVEPDTSSF